MTKTRFALDYSTCTNAELSTFITARNLAISTSNPRRNVIRGLRAADMEITFPFLKLFPEIRTLIYWELLSLRTKRANSNQKYCYPELLSTCQQIHNEAAGILYASENEPTISINPRYSQTKHNTRAILAHVSINDRTIGIPDLLLPHNCIEWPVSLTKFKQLKLDVSIPPQVSQQSLLSYPATSMTVNHALYDCINFLRAHGKVAKFRISITTSYTLTFMAQLTTTPKAEFDRYLEMLAPLHLIEAGKRVFVDAGTGEEISSLESLFGTVRETSGHGQDLLARRRRLEVCTRRCLREELVDDVGAVETAYDKMIERDSFGHFLTVREDEKLKVALDRLEKALGGAGRIVDEGKGS